MTKFKTIILVCFVLAFLAGISTGVLWSRLPKEPRRDSWIERELNLTPEQREQMREIWSGAMGASRQWQREQRRLIREERDNAIRDLFNEDQESKFDAVLQLYEEKSAALDAERNTAFEQTVEQTKMILTEKQRSKYEELLKQRPLGGHRRRGSREGGPGLGEGQPPSRD